jgi:hypothetical protein
MDERGITSYPPLGPDGLPVDPSAAEWGHGRRIDFPVDHRQSCAFCGASEWTVFYPLLTVPPWRPMATPVLPWFWCACDACAHLIEAGDRDDLIARMEDLPFRDRDASSTQLTMFEACRSVPKSFSRSEALSKRPALLG